MSHHLTLPLLAVAIVTAGVLLLVSRASKSLRAAREKFIRGYAFPAIVRERVLRQHPEWSRADLEGALHALREFFLACLAARGTIVRMTSKNADDAWHEFIVCTREYGAFCKKAFGHYLHHKPDPASAGAGVTASCSGYFACSTGSGHGHAVCSGGHGHGCSSSGCSASCGGGGCSSS